MLRTRNVRLLLGLTMMVGTGMATSPPDTGAPTRAASTPIPSRPDDGKRGGWFYYPTGVAVDAAGTSYVADQGSHTILKVSPTGRVSRLAGVSGEFNYDTLTLNGPGETVRFSHPTGVAVNAAGVVYVADTDTHLIRQITPAGIVSTLAGSWDKEGSSDGVGAAARFRRPTGVAVDAAGTVYVADTDNHTIRKISPAGVVSTLAGDAPHAGYTDGPGNVARFDDPAGIAVDAAGVVYVADSGNHRIRKITPAGVVSTLAGNASLAEMLAGGLEGTRGSADGPAATARFNVPAGVAVDAAGTVYVVELGNNAIRRVSPAGEVSTLAGAAHTEGSRNGTGAAARFKDPCGIAVDAAGTVYVADTGNHRIRRISPAGVVSTLAGSGPGGSEPRTYKHRD